MNNNEQNINQEMVNQKSKSHGLIYWLVVIVVGVLVAVGCAFLGMKFYDIVEGNDDEKSILSDEEAMKIGNTQWEYASSATFCGKYKYDENDSNSDGVAITNFDEVNSHFSSDNLIGSSEPKSFKDRETANFTYKNGKYYDHSQCARGEDITYMDTILKITNKKENEIKFTAVSTYCSNPVEDDKKCTGTTSTKNDDFVIKKENNSWKIARFTLPY